MRHPCHRGDSQNGTERFPSLRMPRIVPSIRRLRFDGPLFRFDDPRSSLTHESIFLMPLRPPSATLLHRIAVPREGLGSRLDQMTAWLTRIATRAWAGRSSAGEHTLHTYLPPARETKQICAREEVAGSRFTVFSPPLDLDTAAPEASLLSPRSCRETLW